MFEDFKSEIDFVYTFKVLKYFNSLWFCRFLIVNGEENVTEKKNRTV